MDKRQVFGKYFGGEGNENYGSVGLISLKSVTLNRLPLHAQIYVLRLGELELYKSVGAWCALEGSDLPLLNKSL